MNTNTRQLYATAYHEAGHAFVDWKCGFKVKKASIIPDRKQGSAGHVISKTGLHLRSLEYTDPQGWTVGRYSGSRIGRLHARVICLMAGEAAQRRYRASSVQRSHASSDRDSIMDLLFRIHTHDEMLHVWRYLKAKAKSLVETPMNWFVIKQVAGELLKRRVLTGSEVEAAIRAGYDRHFQRAQKNRSKVRVAAVQIKEGVA